MANTDRPWMTALEKQFLALALASKSVVYADGERRKMPCFHAEVDAVRLLPRCQTYAWSANTAQAVWTASTTIPDDVVVDSSQLLDGMAPQWWWFDWPLPIPMSNPVEGEDLDSRHIVAFLVERSALCGGRVSDDGEGVDQMPGVAISEFRMTSIGPMLVSFAMFPDGATLKENVDGSWFDPGTKKLHSTSRSRALSSLRFVLAASVWLKQRVVSIEGGHIERHRRKQLMREYGAVLSDVKVVQLRRQESQQHGPVSGDEAIEWSCRWVVNGHWRNQYHPSSGKHELKYILPYVKGPDDKPLKMPTATVFAVTR